MKTPELQHFIPTIEYSSASSSVLELINKFNNLYCDIEKKLQAHYRKDFANRLKQARQILELTHCKTPSNLVQCSC